MIEAISLNIMQSQMFFKEIDKNVNLKQSQEFSNKMSDFEEKMY